MLVKGGCFVKAIVNGTLYTVSHGVIENGTILIEDGKIVAIGANLPIPEEAELLFAQGAHVYPGLIDADCKVGIFEEGQGPIGDDTNEPNSIGSEFRAFDATWWEDVAFEDCRRAGITALSIGPGSDNLINGQSFITKTGPGVLDHQVIRAFAGLKINICGTRGNQRDRTIDIAALQGQLQKAKELMVKNEKMLAKGETPEENPKLDPLVALLKGENFARITVYANHDILNALELAKTWGFPLVLERCYEGHLLVDDIVASGCKVIAGPTFINRMGASKNLSLKMPGVLAKAGVAVALCSDHPTMPSENLTTQAALACRDGMPEELALRAITLTAAEILGVADRIGSLEVGKDADFALFSHPIFKTASQCLATMVNGDLVWQAEKEGECQC
jgi:imidazolonepropionase-like amidohydrolase